MREEGLEPSCLSTLEPKSSASTSFAILAGGFKWLRHFWGFVYWGWSLGLQRSAVASELRRGSFISPTVFRPDLPPAFEAVIAQAMAKDPGVRFPSAREFGRALLPFASINSQRKWSEHYVAYNAAAANFEPSAPNPLPTSLASTSKLPPDQTIAEPIRNLDTPPEPQFVALTPTGPGPEYRPEFSPNENRRLSDALAAASGRTKLLEHEPRVNPRVGPKQPNSLPAEVRGFPLAPMLLIAAVGIGAVLFSVLR